MNVIDRARKRAHQSADRARQLGGDTQRVNKDWGWKARKRFFFLVKLTAWLAYLPAVYFFMIDMTPDILTLPAIACTVLGGFVAVPAYLQLIWIFTPEQFLRSKLHFSDPVSAQVSLNSNRSSSGFPKARMAADLRNLVDDHRSSPVSAEIRVRTGWDEWLHVATTLLGVPQPLPSTSTLARAELSRDYLRVAAGYWRPGVVLELPTSRIVGIWKGSEVATIGGGNVLVLVAETDNDLILVPLQVHRWTWAGRSARSVPELIARIEETWGVVRNAPPAVERLRPRRRRE